MLRSIPVGLLGVCCSCWGDLNVLALFFEKQCVFVGLEQGRCVSIGCAMVRIEASRGRFSCGQVVTSGPPMFRIFQDARRKQSNGDQFNPALNLVWQTDRIGESAPITDGRLLHAASDCV